MKEVKSNLIFTKVWQDETLFELEVKVVSEYVTAYQNCYFNDSTINRLSEFLINYCSGKRDTNYYESGSKIGNGLSAFSLRLSSDRTGHITIECDIEIEDVKDRSHRCICNIHTEIGMLEKFAGKRCRLADNNYYESVSLSGD